MYVADNDSSVVFAISTSTGHPVTTISVGPNPGFTFALPDSSKVYVCNNDNTVSVIETATQSVIATLSIPSLNGFGCPTADSSFAYFCQSSSSITKVSAATNSVVTTIPLSNSCLTCISSPDSQFIYAGLYSPLDNQGVNVISVSSNSVVATIPGGQFSHYLIENPISPDGAFIYCTNFGGLNQPSLLVMSTVTHTTVATLDTGNSPNQGGLYFSFSSSSSLSVVGHQIANRFLTQTDLINVISWTAPNNFTPVAYQIFRNASLTDLAGIVSSTTLEFEDHNRKKKQIYTYYIVGIDSSGNSVMGNVTVDPIM